MDLNNLIGDLFSQEMIFMGICLVLEWNTGFLDTLMPLVLSQ
jgi:hypothetical protein